MGQGPVLDAIDAGHIARTPPKGEASKCGECKEQWPCAAMVTARRDQSKYAENVRLNNLITRETRRTYV